MPEPVVLLTSSTIDRGKFIDFLLSAGAILHHPIYDARISQGNKHVWIALESQEHLKVLELDLKAQGQQEIFDLIIEKLGGTPQTSVLLDISDTPSSSKLAVAFACMFSEHWSCVLYDLVGRVYSMKELLVLYQRKQGLPKS